MKPSMEDLRKSARLRTIADDAATAAVREDGLGAAKAQVEWIIYTSEDHDELIRRLAEFLK